MSKNTILLIVTVFTFGCQITDTVESSSVIISKGDQSFYETILCETYGRVDTLSDIRINFLTGIVERNVYKIEAASMLFVLGGTSASKDVFIYDFKDLNEGVKVVSKASISQYKSQYPTSSTTNFILMQGMIIDPEGVLSWMKDRHLFIYTNMLKGKYGRIVFNTTLSDSLHVYHLNSICE